jgi:hypothetical protein
MLFVEHPISGECWVRVMRSSVCISRSLARERQIWRISNEIKVSASAWERTKRPPTFYCAAAEGGRKLLHYINN